MGFDLCFSPFNPSLNTPCKAVSRHTAKAMIETTKAALTICLSIHFDRLIPGLEFQLESMTIGSLLSLWFQTLVVGLTMNILSICIFLVTYGRMIEIYVVTALGPIPLATMGSSEWRSTGQNYLKSLLALGFQAFLIMIVVGIYAVLIRNISGAADIAGAIWGCMGYTVLLCFCLFKTGSISKSVFGAH